MRAWSGVAAALAIVLAGCGDVRRDAAGDIRAFLQAADKGDRMAFEAHIDRLALRADLKGQLMAMPEVRDLHDQLGDEVGDRTVDRMISPESFRVFRAGLAQPLPSSSDAKHIAARLRILARGRVCLRDLAVKDRCLLTFAKQGKAWKLVGLHAADLRAPPPEVS